MASNTLDAGFGSAIIAKGLGGLEFSWDEVGNLYFGNSITPAQQQAIEAAAASYVPSTGSPS